MKRKVIGFIMAVVCMTALAGCGNMNSDNSGTTENMTLASGNDTSDMGSTDITDGSTLPTGTNGSMENNGNGVGGEIATDIGDGISEIATDIGDGISEIATDIGEGVSEIATDIENGINDVTR